MPSAHQRPVVCDRRQAVRLGSSSGDVVPRRARALGRLRPDGDRRRLPRRQRARHALRGRARLGALTDELVVFGTERSGPDAYLAVALAGTIGYLLGSLGGWAIGRLRRPAVPRAARALVPPRARRGSRAPSAGSTAGTTGPSSSAGSRRSRGRSSRSPPACSSSPLARYTVLTAIGSAIWAFGFAGVGYALGASWESFDHAFRYVEIALAARRSWPLVAYLIVRRRRSSTMGRACNRFRSLTSRRSTRRSSRS